VECEFCGGECAILARSASRLWIGCARCHRTLNGDAEGVASLTPDARASHPDGRGGMQKSMARACLVAALSVALALVIRVLLLPVLGDATRS
jgi:hypothetical protein